MNLAIIVAAGSGTRFGADVPKQFLEIGGKPILIHTLERFNQCAEIDEIVLVLAENEIENFQKTLKKFNLEKVKRIIAGGETRAESVRNAVKSIDHAEIVAVHDGARPLVSAEEIAQTFKKAKEKGACCLVGKITDTIKRIENGKIIETIDRESLRRAQTPQTFRFEILQKAFSDENFDSSATDECHLVEKKGFEVYFVEGSARNIKITTREDFALAEIFLR